MIIVKVINQKVVKVALAERSSCSRLISSLLATGNKKQLANITRTLVQSTPQSQKVTDTNNQQLIPIARNISFRQCCKTGQNRTTKANAKVSFSISASSPTTQFISTDLDPSIFPGQVEKDRESPLEILKRKAKGVVEKKDLNVTSKYYGQSFNETLSTTSERKLVVLMSWLQAKEKHIEKYRQFYLDRGFDVLNVKTSALDLLLPVIGTKKISKDFVRFMIEKQYSDVVLHGFSVGGYMFGEVLLGIDQQEEKLRQQLIKSIRGVIFDSIVTFEGTSYGVANSITSHPIGAKVVEKLLSLYLFLGYNIATKYYREVSDKVWSEPLKCPILFLMSKDDKISDHKITERLSNVWNDLGTETHKMLFDSSPHVQLFNKHKATYAERVEIFLKHIKMN